MKFQVPLLVAQRLDALLLLAELSLGVDFRRVVRMQVEEVAPPIVPVTGSESVPGLQYYGRGVPRNTSFMSVLEFQHLLTCTIQPGFFLRNSDDQVT